jgi:hypothetical protein
MTAGGLFKLQLDAAIAKARGRTEALVRKVVLDIGTRLIERSPVGDAQYWSHPAPKGYVGGRFRGSWDYGIDQPPAGADTVDATGQASRDRIAEGVAAAPMASRHFLINALPYARRIEDGWSHRQSPQGVVGITVVEFDGILRGAVQAVRSA